MASTQKRTRILLGLLARPELGEAQAMRLRRVLANPEWKPIPRLPCANVLEPLFVHHLSRLGIPFESSFAPSNGIQLDPPSFVELMRLWSARQRELEDLATEIEKSSLTRVMLFKGAALSPLYPSSALRQMADLDCVVEVSDLAPLRVHLTRHGWRQRLGAYAESWSRHGNLLSIDLHIAKDRLALRILQDSVPAQAVFPRAGILTIPAPSDHLLLVALHAADNAGNRIWRDVCDAQALLAAGADADDAHQLAQETSALPPLEALLAFIGRWCGNADLPRDPTSHEGRRLLAVFEAASVQTISPVQLELMGSMLFDAPVNLARRLFGSGPRTAPHPTTAVERDPVLGTLPAQGTAARLRLRLKLLLDLMRSGRFLRTANLSFQQARLRKNRRLFETPQS